jgi:hypothetical protein
MPTVMNDITSANTISDEEKRRLEEEQAQRNLTLGAAPASQVRDATGAAPSTAPKESGSFKNIGKFLQANVGASGKFAGSVAESTEKGLQSGEQGVKTEGGKLVKTAEESGAFPEISELPSDITTAGSEGFKQVQSGLGAQWAAPKYDFTDFTAAEAGLGKAVKSAESTATQEGLTGLAAQTAKEQEGQRLSAGEKRFSGLLLGKDAAAQGKFAELRKQAGGVKGLAETYIGTEGAKGLIGEAQSAAEKTFGESQAGLRKQVEDLYGTTKTGIETTTAGQAKESEGSRAKLIGELAGVQINQERELSELRNAANDTRNSMPMRQMYTAKYLQKLEESKKTNAALESARSSQGPTAGQYVTPEQAAALNALAALSGRQGVSAGGGYVAPSADIEALRRGFGQAGSGITYEQFLPKFISPMETKAELPPSQGAASLPAPLRPAPKGVVITAPTDEKAKLPGMR